jgi:hypothetical protein
MKLFQPKTAETSKRYLSDAKTSKKPLLLSEETATAIRKNQIKPLELARELWSVYRGPGQLFPTEYFQFNLSDPNCSEGDKLRFASAVLHPDFLKVACNPKWDALTEDKWACYALLGSQHLPHPETLAVIDRSVRSFGTCPKLASADDLTAFLSSAPMPIFAKANTGLGSFGAFVISAYEDRLVRLNGGTAMSASALLADVIGDRTFLLQRVVGNHPDIAAFATGLATIRTVNLVDTNSVRVPFTLLKIPAGGNVADNYWRTGNLIADVDPDTGVIRRAVQGKASKLTALTHHPETGTQLVGFQIPFWRELLAINDACARLYAEVRYHTLDIGITETGPIIVEVNTGGAFDLPQFASGRGFLTDEVMEFFRRCGYTFRGLRS